MQKWKDTKGFYEIIARIFLPRRLPALAADMDGGIEMTGSSKPDCLSFNCSSFDIQYCFIIFNTLAS